MFSARNRGRSLRAIKHYFPFKVASELRDVLIVRVQDGCSSGGQGFDQFVLGPRNGAHGFEVLQVNRRHNRDHSDFRLRDLRQRCDLAGVRHAHFDHGYLMVRFQFEKHEGQPEMIVEIAFRLQYAEAAG